MRTLVLLAALAACLPAHAVNRCVLPSGRVTYTDAACESIGAKLQREVWTGPAPAVPASQPRAATGPVTHPLCYDGTNARPEINSAEVESVLRSGAAAWNGGCRIRFEYVGACTGAADAYRITWISFDPGLQFDGKSIREHAVAAANPPGRVVGMNRDIDRSSFQRGWRRALVHELGHLAGIGHSGDPADLMYPGGTTGAPTASDFALCNKAAGTR